MSINDPIEQHFRLQNNEKVALHKIGIRTLKDLLYYFPVRYGDSSQSKRIDSVENKEEVAIFGKIKNLKIKKAYLKKIPMAEATVSDETGSIRVIWLHQPYIAKMIKEDSLVRIEGKITERNGNFSMMNPKIETVADIPHNLEGSLFGNEGEKHNLYPVYRETSGISSNWLYHAWKKTTNIVQIEKLIDPLPKELLEKYHLPTLATALIWIHSPQNKEDALSARKRFAFQEIFFIQLKKQKDKNERHKEKGFQVKDDAKKIKQFLERFPFKPTLAQTNAIDTILKDFKGGEPMSRLLEGDVGSGKTLVAAATAYACYPEYQVAYMAPTEILARQHFESFISYFGHLPIKIGLITGSGCLKFPTKNGWRPGEASKNWTPISKTQLTKWVANGEISIVIGTHALIYKSVEFKKLAYVIIDEQHRFGTAQRKRLARKQDFTPHLLSMTATPIPRTLALTLYGDLDITLLDQMPLGRKPVISKIIPINKRTEMYEEIKKELKAGRQAYVICPRIDAPDPDKEGTLQAKSVKEEAKRLKEKVFQNYSINILHSKMKPTEKEKVMRDFSEHKTDILVATSVVEVGVNVPNATIIIIEGAERFGLSQLHQLRGRVIRGNHQAYCYLLTEKTSAKSVERLGALTKAKDGFELAELDLKMRGAGELYIGKQWGLTDLAMEAIQNIKMVEFARNEAKDLISRDPSLSNFPFLLQTIEAEEEVHFE